MLNCSEIVSVHRASPQSCCYAELHPVRITLQVPANASRDDVANLGLVALFYQGTTDDVTRYIALTTALQFREWIGGEAAVIGYTTGLARDACAMLAAAWKTRSLPAARQVSSRTS